MTHETLFRILIALLTVCTIAVSGYYRSRANRAGGRIPRRHDGRGFVLLQLLFLVSLPGSLLAYVIEPAWLDWSRFEAPLAWRWAGIAVAALAVPALAWMFHHLGNNVTPTAVVRDEHHLVTTGPYRFIRHPLYTFATLWWLAVSLAIASWWMFLFSCITFVVIARRTRKEESALIERFGDRYRRYMEQTPRYLPRLL